MQQHLHQSVLNLFPAHTSRLQCIDEYIVPGKDVIHDARFKSFEVTAGSLILRNNDYVQGYLTQWMETQESEFSGASPSPCEKNSHNSVPLSRVF